MQIARNQNQAAPELAQILANKLPSDNELTPNEVDKFIEVYNTTEDFIQKDFQRFK
jgi:hypothetical protein